ncbi:o-succinylbenzoate synthase [Aureicoccus marinus]|uniref:O-succinylbenzoate synthase n=1 Tax=Aureicoccus marinus TaxID=754435 RepID=A0A2S7T5A7_9FLAO|nr:o-succinylbenzoate synthase [Aureicoccus marinus]PQJ15112.1 o-succinylbenzoate synthase [Aureicoccus marinus]
MLKARYFRHILQFKRAGGTSRGVLTEKETWYVLLEEGDSFGIGECGLFRGLSADDTPDYEAQLKKSCERVNEGLESLLDFNRFFPSIQFGFEQAFASLKQQNPFELLPSDFTQNEVPISINGLIWMGSLDFMQEQIQEKLAGGFNCLKLKIGALDFEKEWLLLRGIRDRFSAKELEIRVDANGGFSPQDALQKLERLAKLELHSIEQPIKAQQWSEMKSLCDRSPLDIALDEELIGLFSGEDKEEVLDTIQPQYIILKPSLVGGWSGSDEWIAAAEKRGIGWWITSALESNLGLNAIAQYTYLKNNPMPQGLGTGGLFTNNWQSPLEVSQGQLIYRKELSWNNDIKHHLCT